MAIAIVVIAVTGLQVRLTLTQLKKIIQEELNAYNSENGGLFENPELAMDEDALKTISGIIKVSEYRARGNLYETPT